MSSFSTKRDYPKEIAAIHQEFSLTAEQLLKEANAILNAPIKTKYEKSERLRLVGFTQAEQSNNIQPRGPISAQESIDRELAVVIRSYQFKYPEAKFITEDQVRMICEKYKLILGSIDKYKGFVPDANLEIIERFLEVLKQEDVDDEIIGSERYDGLMVYDNGRAANRADGCKYNLITKKAPLRICAPLTQMDMSGRVISENYKMQEITAIQDPVVLQPVKGGYLIVTAWGDEASDEIIINQNHN